MAAQDVIANYLAREFQTVTPGGHAAEIIYRLIEAGYEIRAAGESEARIREIARGEAEAALKRVAQQVTRAYSPLGRPR